MAIEIDPYDPLPDRPPDAVPIRPSLAEQQRAHAAQQPTPPTSGDDSLPDNPNISGGMMNQPWTQDMWHKLGVGARAVTEGLGGVVGGVGDILTAPGRIAMRAVGYQPPKELPWMQDLTTAPSTQIQGAIDTTGLPKPATPTEQNIATFERGATAAALAGPRAGIAGGTGALGGEKAAESDVVPPWAKPTVQLLGNIAGGVAGDKFTAALNKVANYAAGVQSPFVQALDRLRIDPGLAGTVSGNPTAQSLEAFSTRAPFASAIVRPAQERMVNQFGDAVERTATGLSPTATSAQEAGQTLQQSMRNWRDNIFPAQQAAAWNPLNQRMAGAAVTPANYRNQLNQLTQSLGLPETQQALTPGRAFALRDALTADIPPNGSMTWNQAQQVRSLIGHAMGVPEISASLGQDTLRRAYAGMAQDMRNTAIQHGQEGPFDAANAVSTAGHSFLENTGSKIIRSNNPAQESINPEQAASNILNSGDTHLQAVRDNLPDGADALAAHKLRQMATAKPSQAGATGTDTSTGTFLTNYNQMRQQKPAGTAALFNTNANPTVQQQLEDLSTVAGRLRATEKHLNTSGTGEYLGWQEYGRAIGEALAQGRFGHAAAATVIPPLLGPAVGRMVTNPTVARFSATPVDPPRISPRLAGLLGGQL